MKHTKKKNALGLLFAVMFGIFLIAGAGIAHAQVCDTVSVTCTANPGEVTVTEKDDCDEDTYAAYECPDGYVCTSGNCGDCDDDAVAINPGATEVCNDGIDNDCDGDTDCDDADCTADPACVCGTVSVTCTANPGEVTVTEKDDCDEDTYAAYECPDGYVCTSGNCGDCNDDAVAINPGATEVCNDGIDNDCDGDTDCDDADCTADAACVCDTVSVTCTANPGEVTVTEKDDCDEDTYAAYECPDGYVCTSGNCGDCDDGAVAINPGATEVCNDGIDNDCDGDTDCDDADCTADPACVEGDDDDDDAAGDDSNADSFVPDETSGGGNPGGTTSVPQLSVTAYIDVVQTKTTKSFNIQNTGSGLLEWTIGPVDYNEGSGWITSITPSEGKTSSLTQVTFTVSRDGLAEGVYTAEFSVASNGGNAQVVVSMAVEVDLPPPAPDLGVDPASLDFGTADTEATVTLSNFGDEAGAWAIETVYADGQGWLSIAPDMLSLDPGADDTLTVNVDRQGLEAGTYNAQIKIVLQSEEFDEEEVIDVTMRVLGEGAVLNVQPERLIFYERAAAEEQTISVQNNGTDASLTWQVGEIQYPERAEDWILLEPSQGVVEPAGEQQVALTVNRDGLQPGFYIANIKITSQNAGTANIQVIMWVPLIKGLRW